jgi:hypothetical protein
MLVASFLLEPVTGGAACAETAAAFGATGFAAGGFGLTEALAAGFFRVAACRFFPAAGLAPRDVARFDPDFFAGAAPRVFVPPLRRFAVGIYRLPPICNPFPR